MAYRSGPCYRFDIIISLCRCLSSGFWLGLRAPSRRSLRRCRTVLAVIGPPRFHRRRRVLEVTHRHHLVILTNARSSLGVVIRDLPDLGLSWTSSVFFCVLLWCLCFRRNVHGITDMGWSHPSMCIAITCHCWATVVLPGMVPTNWSRYTKIVFEFCRQWWISMPTVPSRLTGFAQKWNMHPWICVFVFYISCNYHNVSNIISAIFMSLKICGQNFLQVCMKTQGLDREILHCLVTKQHRLY